MIIGSRDVNVESAKDRLHLDAMAKVGNTFRTVIVAAKRVRQLNAGAARRTDRKWNRLDLIALDEIAQGKAKAVVVEEGD